MSSSAIKDVESDGYAFKVIKTQEGSETWDSNGDVTGYEVKYYVIGHCPKRTAMKAVLDDAETDYNGLSRQSVKFDSVDDDGNYEITVSYVKKSGSVSNGGASGDTSTLSFECGGGTKKVKTSIGEQCRVIDNNAPDPGRFIGWNGKTGDDSQIDGVDIPTAQMRETYTKEMNLSSLSTLYRRNIAAMVGKVNSGKFKGWERGEVMFLGCSFSGSKADGKITVSFNFNIQPGETVDLSDIADGESGTVSKEGFEYIWTISETKTENKQPKTVVKGAWIAKVTGYADFSQLGV